MSESLSSTGREAERKAQTKQSLLRTHVQRARSARQRDSLGASDSIFSELDKKPKFRIVIVHEDGLTGRRAQHFYNDMIHDLADACNFRLDRWSFRAISIPEIGDLALQLAGQADFVIVSMRGKVKFPTKVRDWIDQWSVLTTDSRPVLVALFDQPDRSRGAVASAIQYLRNVAGRKNTGFFAYPNFRTYAD